MTRRFASNAALGLAAVWLSLASGCDNDPFETTHGAVDRGNEELLSGQAEAAFKSYEEAAGEVPESDELAYDRGLALSELGQHLDAARELLRAIDTKDQALRQRVLATLGLTYCRWALELEAEEKKQGGTGGDPTAPEDSERAKADSLKKWEKAVEYLEEALELDPTDEPVLRNLEVALLRVDPPCGKRDDGYEPNNTFENGKPVELAAAGMPAAPPGAPPGAPPAADPTQPPPDQLEWREKLFSCPDDADFFRVSLSEGDRLAATLKPEDGEGRLGLRLLAPDGRQQLRPPADSSEPISALELSIDRSEGQYGLVVDNVDGEERGYELEVVVRPPCWKTEDRFDAEEGNDDAQHARLIKPVEDPEGKRKDRVAKLDRLKICPLDEDWFAVELGEGDSLFALVSPSASGEKEQEEPAGGDEDEPAAPPELELELSNPEGTVRAAGAPAGQARMASLLTPGPGRYLVRIKGQPESELRYDLILSVLPPCPDGDDQHEENDDAASAVDLTAQAQAQPQPGGGMQAGGGQSPGQQAMLVRICSGDVDWWKATSTVEQPTIVTIAFEHAKGDLMMTLHAEGGGDALETSDVSSLEKNGEALALPKPEDDEEEQTFTIQVAGKRGAENFYLLKLEQPQGDGQKKNQDQDEDQDQDQDQDQNEDQDEQKQPKEDKPQPLEDSLDKLDHNPQNLEARKKARESPRADHPPEKDW